MKKLFNSKIALAAVLLSAICLGSCSDDMQSPVEIAAPETVPVSIQADFTRSYPDATEVTWNVSNGYAVASFVISPVTNRATTQSGHHSAAWYCLNDNQKKMHSAPVSFADLPTAVTAAFYAGEYSTLTPCDPAHVLTRYIDDNVDHIYVIKAKGALEGTISTAVKLFYTADGLLVKLSSEIVYDESYAKDEDVSEFEEWLPQTPADFVKEYIGAHYPDAHYLHIYEGQDFTKAKILDGHTIRLVLFDADGAWISTATQIDKKDIPAEILAGFRASDFAEWHINKITEYATASDDHYYMLSLENGKNKTELRIEADGTLTETPATPDDSDNSTDPSDENSYLAKADIEGFVLAKYPGASVIKSDYDSDEAEVEILYNNHKIKVEFELYAQGYAWTHSEWDFNIKDTASLPVSISNTLSEKYSAYRLEFLTYHETAGSGCYYEAGLKSSQTKKTIKVQMDEEGNVIAEYGKN